MECSHVWNKPKWVLSLGEEGRYHYPICAVNPMEYCTWRFSNLLLIQGCALGSLQCRDLFSGRKMPLPEGKVTEGSHMLCGIAPQVA